MNEAKPLLISQRRKLMVGSSIMALSALVTLFGDAVSSWFRVDAVWTKLSGLVVFVVSLYWLASSLKCPACGLEGAVVRLRSCEARELARLAAASNRMSQMWLSRESTPALRAGKGLEQYGHDGPELHRQCRARKQVVATHHEVVSEETHSLCA